MSSHVRQFIREVIRQERFLDKSVPSYASSRELPEEESTSIAKGVMQKVRDASSIRTLLGGGKSGGIANRSGIWGKAGARTKAVLAAAGVAAAVVALATVGKNDTSEATDEDQRIAGEKVDNFLAELNRILSANSANIREKFRTSEILQISKEQSSKPEEGELPGIIRLFDTNYKTLAGKMNTLPYTADSNQAGSDIDDFYVYFPAYEVAKDDISTKIDEVAAGDDVSKKSLSVLASRFLALHAREQIQSCMATDYSDLSTSANIRAGTADSTKIETIIEDVDRTMDSSNAIKISEKAFK